MDADWEGDLDEHKSTSEYAFLLNDTIISWPSKKQSCLALSTIESLYVSSVAVVQEALWLRIFLQNLEWYHMLQSCYHYDTALTYVKYPK